MGSTNILDLNNRVSELEKSTADSAKRSDIATEFNATTAYTAGCFVYHEGKLYIFNVDHAAGAWDATEVSESNVTDEVTSNKAAIDGLTDTVEEALNNYYNINDIVASVTADGVKTVSQLLNELYAATESVSGSRFVLNAAGIYLPSRIGYKTQFSTMYLGSNNNLELYYARLQASGSQYGHEVITTTTHAIGGNDNSSDVPANGKTYTVYKA